MPETPVIAATGASGAIGSGETARLAAATRQRLMVRDQSRAPHRMGAEVRQASEMVS